MINERKSPEMINENDGLSHKVCMRCIGTLEFIDDFHQTCHVTQQKFNETKAKCRKIKEKLSPDLEDDTESDKENTSPNGQIGIKRKRQTLNIERTKSSKSMPLGIKKNLSINIEDTDRIRADKEIDKNKENNIVEMTIETSEVSPKPLITKAKCDSSTKTEITEINDDELPISSVEYSERRTRSSNSIKTNHPKRSQNNFLNTPKSKPVPVIVKLEKQESLEVASIVPLKTKNRVKSNEHVWIPISAMLPEGDRPKSSRNGKRHDQCPTAGDEAKEIIEKTPETSSTRFVPITDKIEDISINESVRKSVIETTIKSKISKNSIVPRIKETRLSTSGSKKRKIYTEEDIGEDEDDEGESNEGKKKFGRISDLISDEQKVAIETFYTVDMSVVDEEVVGEKIVFLEKKRFGCTICKANYPRQDKCQVHIWGHLEMKPYRCKACDFATVTVSNIRCHIRKSHLKIKPFSCEVCEKRYVTAFLLEEHMNTHTGSRPYSCNVCNFTSASRQVLTYHNETHKLVKDITCDVCGKGFYSKARMRAHMVIHNKDKAANMCKLCSIYLCNSDALQRHYANVHSQDYICNICDKRCQSRKALNNHQNVHSAAKFKCTLCSNVYKSSHILKEHLLKHKGIRKYKCNICNKDFAQQSHLAAHMAVHSEKKFLCPGCNRGFNRHDNMKMHTKRCDIFIAKPELKSLLTIRRSRSKPDNGLEKNLNEEIVSLECVEAEPNKVENSERLTTDGIFLKIERLKTDSHVKSSEDS